MARKTGKTHKVTYVTVRTELGERFAWSQAVTFFCVAALSCCCVLSLPLLGPEPFQESRGEWLSQCSGLDRRLGRNCSDCDASEFGIHLGRMSPQHQALSVNFRQVVDAEDVQDVFTLKQRITIRAWGVNADGSRDELVHDSEKYRDITCPAMLRLDTRQHRFCEEYEVFTEYMVGYSDYDLEIHMSDLTGNKHKFKRKTSNSSLLCMGRDMSLYKDRNRNNQAKFGWLIHVTLRFISRSFTQFEVAVKSILAILSLFVLVAYHTLLRKVPYRQRLHEQNWVELLLFTLLFFNDPFVAVQVFYPLQAFIVLYILSFNTFMALLLLFWLWLLDHARIGHGGHSQSDQGTKGNNVAVTSIPSYISRHSSKSVITLTAWTTYNSVYIFISLKEKEDPAYDPNEDFHSYWVFKALFAGFSLVYAAWLLVLILLLLKRKTQIGHNLARLVLLSCCMIIGTIVYRVKGEFTVPVLSSEFLAFQATMNVYVFAITLLYVPVKVRVAKKEPVDIDNVVVKALV